MNVVCQTNLKDGLSGIMRAKNEAQFIEASIDSCINALDELIIVYNDCTDETPEIIEKKRKQYPEKIKAYAYNHKLLAYNLTEEELRFALNLPEDSPRLYSNQCNYALSKVTYKYAVKIDADQIYFTEELKKWRDVCGRKYKLNWHFCLIWGWVFMIYISIYRRISVKLAKRPCLCLFPKFLIKFFKRRYEEFMMWKLQKGNVTISISGINVYYDGRWWVTCDDINNHPPYNGSTDHLIFKVSENTYYTKYYQGYPSHYVIELFHQPYQVMLADSFFWFHQHANRKTCWGNVNEVKVRYPGMFVPIDEFVKMPYKSVQRKMKCTEGTLFERTLFGFIHKMGIKSVEKNIPILEKCLK